MKLFRGSTKADRIGAVIDIGSGSVAVSIVHSNAAHATPTIVWHHREQTRLKNIQSLEQSAKAVMAALLNALIKLDGEGRSALKEYPYKGKISEIQYSISAPWSYTVAKKINYSQEENFVVTDDMIEELVEMAKEKTAEELTQNEATKQMGLQMITETTMDIIANGYRTRNPDGEESKDLAINHVSAVTQEQIINEISELNNKIFSTNAAKKLSFVLVLYCITQDLFPKTENACLIDVTYEATEIGIVRQGSLRYSTHTPFGSFSIAREISLITGMTLAEAFGHLHTEKPLAFLETVTKAQKEDIDQMFAAYVDRLAALFTETGDELSIPKRIYLHVDQKSEPLFKDLIEKAAKQQLKSQPIVRLITPELLALATKEEVAEDGPKETLVTDTALLVSAQFFHKQNHCRSFEYL